MTGVAVDQPTAERIQNAVKDGHEQFGVHVGDDALVGYLQQRFWVLRIGRGIGADQCTAQRHEQCRAHAFVDHIGDHDPQAPIRQGDEIIEISRCLACRPPCGCDLPAGNFRQVMRQQARLNPTGKHQLLAA